jgi:peptide/nickel transport system ATP-binding protein
MSELLTVTGMTVRSASDEIVRPLDLTISAGRTVAIVGESGSGKSLTARTLTGLLPNGLSASGTLTLAGTEIDLSDNTVPWRNYRGGAVSLLLQDPFTSLSPVHKCGAQIAATITAASRRSGTRRSAREVASLVTERLREVGLDANIASKYPHQLSGGMRQRVAIAAAIAADPVVLIADEPTTALDASTQEDVLDVLSSLQRSRGLGILLISHDLSVVRGCADDVIVLYAGDVVERGPASQVLVSPVHPYTAGLLAADPPLERRLAAMPGIPGSVPKPGERPGGCVFADRCPLVTELCRTDDPSLRPVAAGVSVACHHSSTPLPSLTDDEETISTSQSVEPALLRIVNLTARHGATVIVEDANLELAPGTTLGIVGESGSGKTTLARCIAGLHTDFDGDIYLRDEPLPRRLNKRDPRLVQIVFQDPYSALNPIMSVGDALAEALAVAGRPRTDVQVVLAQVGLPAHYAAKKPRDLSGGERQRVAIARAIAPAPEVLVCDESVSALDVSVQAQILTLLNELRESTGIGIVFISHDLAVVRQMCDRVAVLRGGIIVESGDADQVFSNPHHEYTRQLLEASRPRADASQKETV